MFWDRIKRVFRWPIIFFLVGIGLFLLPRVVTGQFASSRIKGLEEISPAPVAIVFGAGLRRDGGLTAVLRDRVTSGAALYLAGKVQILLMSGESPEPTAMKDYAIELGVAAEDILLDNGGLRTYDSCYRAVQIYGYEHAILVTQDFHLPRALYTCNALGMPAEGLAADNYYYRRRTQIFWNIREIFATVVALWDVHISAPTPTMIKTQANLLQE